MPKTVISDKTMNPASQTAGRIGMIAIAAMLMLGNIATAQDPAEYFEDNCSACHTIGEGVLLAPDLKGVLDRRDRAWLVRFITNPKKVIDSGDSYAAKLVVAAEGIIMPPADGMTETIAEDMISYIESKSGGPASESEAAAAIVPLTPEDIAIGQALFTGAHPLTNGGPACMGCHSNAELPALGGGALGPDLTQVFKRLKGQRSLGAWLKKPATPVMRTILRGKDLTPEEIRGLVAYFENSSQGDAPAGSRKSGVFVFLGLGSAIVIMILFDIIWRQRYRGVRQQLRTLTRGAR